MTISDIHFLHNVNESSHISESFYGFMDGYTSKSKFSKLDIIFLAGDIFDTYKDSKHPDMIIVLNWMMMMMAFCKKFGIKLRVLEGTPGHDYKQSNVFNSLAEAFGEGLDYKYVEVLSIEKMADLGLDILYVPDEWAGSAAKCQEQVQELLDMHQIDKVDIACMHGMFDFQIPALPDDHPLKHNSEWYLSKVRYFINIGHDHNYKTKGRIIVQGSFDRISHGEEAKKGAVICYLRLDGDNRFEFIENKNARIFKTITIKSRDLDTAIDQIKAVLIKCPDNANIRISTSLDNPILGVMDEFKRAHPRMRFKKHSDKHQLTDNRNDLQQALGLSAEFIAISLTKDNIIDQMLSGMESELKLIKPEDKALLLSELESIL